MQENWIDRIFRKALNESKVPASEKEAWNAIRKELHKGGYIKKPGFFEATSTKVIGGVLVAGLIATGTYFGLKNERSQVAEEEISNSNKQITNESEILNSNNENAAGNEAILYNENVVSNNESTNVNFNTTGNENVISQEVKTICEASVEEQLKEIRDGFVSKENTIVKITDPAEANNHSSSNVQNNKEPSSEKNAITPSKEQASDKIVSSVNNTAHSEEEQSTIENVEVEKESIVENAEITFEENSEEEVVSNTTVESANSNTIETLEELGQENESESTFISETNKTETAVENAEQNVTNEEKEFEENVVESKNANNTEESDNDALIALAPNTEKVKVEKKSEKNIEPSKEIGKRFIKKEVLELEILKTELALSNENEIKKIDFDEILENSIKKGIRSLNRGEYARGYLRPYMSIDYVFYSGFKRFCESSF